MNILPRIPTDNLYKFMAISGLWFIAGFIVLYVWLVNFEIQQEENAINSSSYYRSVILKDDIELRLSSINAGNFDKNKLEWIPSSYSIEKETGYLKYALKNHEENIEPKKAFKHIPMSRKLKILNRPGIQITLTFYVTLMVALTFYGFKGWFKNFHKIEIELLHLDIKIKQGLLEKNDMETSHLKSTERKYTRSLDRKAVNNKKKLKPIFRVYNTHLDNFKLQSLPHAPCLKPTIGDDRPKLS